MIYHVTRWSTHILTLVCLGWWSGAAGPVVAGTIGPLSAAGVVVLHGKAATTNWIGPLADALRDAGARVSTPEMAWSRARIYDRSYLDSLAEVDAAVRKLRAQGARHLFVAGHSLGANVALGHAARRNGLAGVIMLAPGHFPARPEFQRRIRESLRAAGRLIAEGRAGVRFRGRDIDQGQELRVVTTPVIYLSWMGATGPAAMTGNAAALCARAPVLWVAGDRDPLAATVGKADVYDRLPHHPQNRFVLVDADHLHTPTRAAPAVQEWMMAVIRTLPAP